MTGARARGTALGLCVLGAALMLLAGGQVWFRGRSLDPGVPGLPIRITGRDVAAIVSAVGLLALAGAVVSLLIGNVARRIVATVVLIAAFVAIGRCLYVLGRQDDATEKQVVDQTLDNLGAATGSLRLDMNAWPWIAALGCLVLIAGAIMQLVTSSAWPDRSSRYDAKAPSPSGKVSAEPTDEADAMWKALDRGEDPTAPTDASSTDPAP